MNPNIEHIRLQRLQISPIESALKEALKGLSKRPETTLAYRNIQMAFAWLGKCLEFLNAPNPYPNSTNPENSVIEERSDFASPAVWPDFETEIQFIKSMRAAIDEQVIGPLKSNLNIEENNLFKIAANTAFIHASNAKMCLGFVLSEIRDELLTKGKVEKEGVPMPPEPPVEEPKTPADGPPPVDTIGKTTNPNPPKNDGKKGNRNK